MKIICVGRNYAEHAKELGNEVPSAPVLFIKPETALNTTNDFYLPTFSNEVHFELELVLRISQTGKKIHIDEASKYYHEIGLGIDFTARDIQSQLKEKGYPWEIAKAFDGSAAVSEFIPISQLKNSKNIEFELYLDDSLKQKGSSMDMIFDFASIINHASKYFTLEKGDLIFTGTPKGVGEIKANNQLKAYLEGRELLNITVNSPSI